jgi:hypothetical protein
MPTNGCCTEWEQEIVLYLDDELSPQGRSRVERHLSRCLSCSSFYRELEREEYLLAGRLCHEAHPFFPTDEFTDEVMNTLPVSNPRTYSRKIVELVCAVSRIAASKGHRHVAVAASILICLAGVLVTLSMGNMPQERMVKIKRFGTFYDYRIHEPIYVTDSRGEFFEFPDGTTAVATNGTCFTIESYQEGSSDSNVGEDRQLRLMFGALFLDVRAAKERFSVRCANARASVFGTQFYIHINRGPHKETTVAVRQGRVQVEKLGQDQMVNTVLSERQMTRVYSTNGVVRLQTPSPIDGALLRDLDLFDKARSDRSFQQIFPIGDDYFSPLSPLQPLSEPSQNS